VHKWKKNSGSVIFVVGCTKSKGPSFFPSFSGQANPTFHILFHSLWYN